MINKLDRKDCLIGGGVALAGACLVRVVARWSWTTSCSTAVPLAIGAMLASVKARSRPVGEHPLKTKILEAWNAIPEPEQRGYAIRFPENLEFWVQPADTVASIFPDPRTNEAGIRVLLYETQGEEVTQMLREKLDILKKRGNPIDRG